MVAIKIVFLLFYCFEVKSIDKEKDLKFKKCEIDKDDIQLDDCEFTYDEFNAFIKQINISSKKTTFEAKTIKVKIDSYVLKSEHFKYTNGQIKAENSILNEESWISFKAKNIENSNGNLFFSGSRIVLFGKFAIPYFNFHIKESPFEDIMFFVGKKTNFLLPYLYNHDDKFYIYGSYYHSFFDQDLKISFLPRLTLKEEFFQLGAGIRYRKFDETKEKILREIDSKFFYPKVGYLKIKIDDKYCSSNMNAFFHDKLRRIELAEKNGFYDENYGYLLFMYNESRIGLFTKSDKSFMPVMELCKTFKSLFGDLKVNFISGSKNYSLNVEKIKIDKFYVGIKYFKVQEFLYATHEVTVGIEFIDCLISDNVIKQYFIYEGRTNNFKLGNMFVSPYFNIKRINNGVNEKLDLGAFFLKENYILDLSWDFVKNKPNVSFDLFYEDMACKISAYKEECFLVINFKSLDCEFFYTKDQKNCALKFEFLKNLTLEVYCYEKKLNGANEDKFLISYASDFFELKMGFGWSGKTKGYRPIINFNDKAKTLKKISKTISKMKKENILENAFFT